MVDMVAIPQLEFTLNGTTVTGFQSGTVDLGENEFWTAQLIFSNSPSIYPDVVDIGDTVKVEVRDGAGGRFSSNTTLFEGTMLYPDYSFGSPSILVALQCVGKGYGLAMMNCAEEYGTQSRNSTLDTIKEVITGNDGVNPVTVGLIPNYVNKYNATANASGYSIDTTKVETLAETIPYIVSPWKPADKFLMDVCDLVTAIAQSGSNAGPHWIVDHDGYLRLKRVGATQTGWTKYYGNSAANATLTAGVDFLDGDFQPVGVEANVVLYAGVWRRPANGDAWTYGSGWGDGGHLTPSSDTGLKIVGADSLRMTSDDGALDTFYYPSAQNAGWDFTNVESSTYIPTIDFYVSRHQVSSLTFGIYTGGANHIDTGDFAGAAFMANIDQFYHFSLKIGEHWTDDFDTGAANKWIAETGTVDWSNINYILFTYNPSVGAGDYINIDGLQFGNVPLYRVARQEFPNEVVPARGTLGSSSNPIRFKIITDNVGKDDSLIASDDSGLMAQLAKAELLRLSKTTSIGRFSTHLIPDVWPGQYFYISSTDYRIMRATHSLGKDCRTSFVVTDDVTNSRSRVRYEDVNKVYASIRPEWQDRQSTSIKAGAIDINVPILEYPYNI